MWICEDFDGLNTRAHWCVNSQGHYYHYHKVCETGRYSYSALTISKQIILTWIWQNNSYQHFYILLNETKCMDTCSSRANFKLSAKENWKLQRYAPAIVHFLVVIDPRCSFYHMYKYIFVGGVGGDKIKNLITYTLIFNKKSINILDVRQL